MGQLSTKTLVNINGNLTSAEDAKISIFDRGFLFGDSVYESLRTYRGIPFLLEEHLTRLERSAHGLNMTIKIPAGEIIQEVKKTVAAMGSGDMVLRIILTRGVGAIGLDPALTEGPNNLVIIAQEKAPNPSWWYERGVDLILVQMGKLGIKKNDPNIKSGNYQANMLAHMIAKERQVYDAIMVNPSGYITEGPTFNVWMVKKNKITTPPLNVGLLEGITRQKILQVVPPTFKISEKKFTPKDLLKADECFITSSTREVVPVKEIEGKIIGEGIPGVVTLKVLEIYRRFIDSYFK